MSCNGEAFTMEPLDVVIISPQVGHATLALEEDVIAFVMHVGNEFYQQYDQILVPINLYCVQIIVLVIINSLQPYGIMQL